MSFGEARQYDMFFDMRLSLPACPPIGSSYYAIIKPIVVECPCVSHHVLLVEARKKISSKKFDIVVDMRLSLPACPIRDAAPEAPMERWTL